MTLAMNADRSSDRSDSSFFSLPAFNPLTVYPSLSFFHLFSVLLWSSAEIVAVDSKSQGYELEKSQKARGSSLRGEMPPRVL